MSRKITHPQFLFKQKTTQRFENVFFVLLPTHKHTLTHITQQILDPYWSECTSPI